MNYVLRLLIAVDQLLNVALCNGQPDETMSSAAYRMEQEGRFWGFMRPVIDALFSVFEKGHCETAYLAERKKLQLPMELRTNQDEVTGNLIDSAQQSLPLELHK